MEIKTVEGLPKGYKITTKVRFTWDDSNDIYMVKVVSFLRSTSDVKRLSKNVKKPTKSLFFKKPKQKWSDKVRKEIDYQIKLLTDYAHEQIFVEEVNKGLLDSLDEF